ncbi:MAG: hypothetical protein K9M98_11055 [Cephaloticoccus sp.]|nr:hypothetical protein [Cephaloticoccus sp.]MCF7761028.1 hypothetical protein [Cephaloticoccus sp.]
MQLPKNEQDFLRDLVKASRQRPNPVSWVDRDGTARITALLPAEMSRLDRLARQVGLSKSAVLEQASFLPAKPSSSRP